jgi:hypothetical protein
VNRARFARFAAALALAAGAASADLLVTRDGATIETAGPWRVEGRRVIFTGTNGTLSSIRTDEVDLDRSALATARAAESAAGAAEPAAVVTPGAPILRLDEDDLPTVSEEGEPEGKKPEPATEPDTPLRVKSFDQAALPNDDGIQIFGVVENTGRSHLTSVSVTATLYGEEGGMLANGDAQLNQTTIAPGATANFRIEFPGLPDFASVKFNTAARGFETVRPEGDEDAAFEPEGEAPPPDDESQYEEEASEPPPAG